MNLNCLDDSLLGRIFNSLSISDRVRCSAVCKHWLELIELVRNDELVVYHSKPVKLPSSGVLIKTNDSLNKLLTASKFKQLKKLKIHINNQVIVEPTIDLSNFVSLEQLEINYSSPNRKMFDILNEKGVQLTSLKCLNVYRVDLSKVFDYFPNLTHIKTAFADRMWCTYAPDCRLEYFEQYHQTPVDRNLIDFLISSCKSLEYLTVTVTSFVKISVLIAQLTNLKELNFNIANEYLRPCFKYKPSMLKATGQREIIVRINGLRLRSDTQIDKYKVDPDEVFLITYRDLQRSNELCNYSKDELKYYFNNFKELEITEKTLQVIKPLFVYDLILKRLKKMTYHFSNRNSANYFFEKFFPKIPNLEHLFIAEIENLTTSQLDQLPVLFPKISNLELHSYKPVEFRIEFIQHFEYLQILVIQSSGFLKDNLHHIVKDLKYLNSLEIDPIYDEIVNYVENKSNDFVEVRCHLHPFSSESKECPIRINNVCRERHAWFDSLIFEDFDAHNYRF